MLQRIVIKIGRGLFPFLFFKDVRFLNFKAKKSFHAYNLQAHKGETYTMELDEHTFKNWVENGLIEEVKEVKKKLVKSNDN
jgi:hypothetical protein